MGLAAFKQDFDDLAAKLQSKPARPFAHPILDGVYAPKQSQQILDRIDAFENGVIEWRTSGISILHQLRRALGNASKAGEADVIRYAVDDTVPQIVSAITAVQTILVARTDRLTEAEENRLPQADKRFYRYLVKRDRDFGRSMAAKLDHLRDGFLTLAWDVDPEARGNEVTLQTDDDVDAFFAGLPNEE